ncbi:RNA polymerase sigma factor RpoH [Alphaproteobacteria bacterium]|nr:RNA polymerase sigma factor RpoH [Alphaproteobacteria bacterium]
MSNITLPSISAGGSLRRYLAEIGQFPVLRKDEEYTLAKNWREHEDIDAAHTLVTSHLRLVAKIAMGYRGYGLPISDLISEGNIGLMKAVKRFDPDKGFRLATYALLWIKASIQEYVLHSWSLVKIGTTSAQKKLFFNLRRVKNELKVFEEKELSPEIIKKISHQLVVEEQEVINMNQRINGDYSLNAPRQVDSNEGDWQEILVDEKSIDQETYVAEKQEIEKRKSMLGKALSLLSERERTIFSYRRLAEEPKTLEVLSKEFNISRERVRQIEVKAFEKVQLEVKNISNSHNNLVIENHKNNKST